MKIIFALLLAWPICASAQDLPHDASSAFFKDGVNFEHGPTHFKTKFRFRVQSRFSYETEDADNFSSKVADFNIRRMRMRFDGTVIDPRLLYRVQLSFSRGDMDFDRTEYPNILRDAVIGWRLSEQTTIFYGQTKLPGNRQRVISSGSQQFVDRSLLNATFNIDRDLGAQLHHKIGDERLAWIKLAISNGEGRATENKDNGLSYTSRLEWLPLGNFKDEGDYFEGDLARQEVPKISMGLVYSINKKTTRPGGQLGQQFKTLGLNRNLETMFADFLLKYRGFSWSSEYAKRWTHQPVFLDGANKVAVYKGQALNTQVGYVFENNVEPALRYTQLFAHRDTLLGEDDRKQYTAALSKYINKHSVKVQGDVTYDESSNRVLNKYKSSWMLRLQVELGI